MSAQGFKKISLIVPILNEGQSLDYFLKKLQHICHAQCEAQCEIIVVDGGSRDESRQIAKKYCDKFVESDKGRATQMNLGAQHASGDVLLFVHADTLLPNDFFLLITNGLVKKDLAWGRFNVSLSGKKPVFRLIENMMNIRSYFTGIATGDQAMFVTKAAFDDVSGFANIPLMEDVALSRQLKKISRPLCLTERVVTSSRRWEQCGVWRTIFLMWRLRLAYFFGASPAELKKKYQ